MAQVPPRGESAAPWATAGERASTADCQYVWTVYGLVGSGVRAYLEGAAEAEDAVVGLLGREALDGLEDDVGLFWDQVVGSVGRLSAFASPWLSSTVLGRVVGAELGFQCPYLNPSFL